MNAPVTMIVSNVIQMPVKPAATSAKPVMPATRPYPRMRRASDADLAWEPYKNEQFGYEDGVAVKSGDNFCNVRPGWARWPLGNCTDHFVDNANHIVTHAAIMSEAADRVSPMGAYISGQGYQVIRGYQIRHVAAQVSKAGLVSSRLLCCHDYTGKAANRSSLVIYVGGVVNENGQHVGAFPIGSIVRDRAIHVTDHQTGWASRISAMIELSTMVQDSLLSLLEACAARRLTDVDVKTLEGMGMKFRNPTDDMLLSGMTAYLKGHTSADKMTFGIYERRLDSTAIEIACEFLGQEMYGTPIDLALTPPNAARHQRVTTFGKGATKRHWDNQ